MAHLRSTYGPYEACLWPTWGPLMAHWGPPMAHLRPICCPPEGPCVDKSRVCPEFVQVQTSKLCPGGEWAGNGQVNQTSFVYQYLSSICRRFVQYLYKPQILWYNVSGKYSVTRTNIVQTLDFRKSRECPTFVQMQCDQVGNGKNIKSKYWLVLVPQFFSQFWPTQMTKRGQKLEHKDINWIWWGQRLD